MIETLTSEAEKAAVEAESLTAFSGIKLLHIKRHLALILELIGREGIFDEYTRHDISHIDEMLKMLVWLIPDATKAIMTPADWLMTVLAIYFHDLGMLVTKEEYQKRSFSGFSTYRDQVLFAGESGRDYRSKVAALSDEDRERFLYQEFIRHKHAERIRSWVTGQARETLGITNSVVIEIDKLLKQLTPQFRRDLALICESHHLDDLDVFKKYKCSQPYGNTPAEAANLQYAAILLRTVDLLHITKDRTPSISFHLINPLDPISQQEWAKQMAVTSVRAKLGRDRDGNPDPKAPRDTIEVHAYFTREDGFFGLTSYLSYASAQLEKSYEWAVQANKTQGSRHHFPWRYIDDSNIETEGFLRDTFEFTIHHEKILDLLTGHTLYNDTSVVLRELVQNSLDAIRLQYLVDQQKQSNSKSGRVTILYDRKQHTLSVVDNGTGMTQEIIERHFLKVGASRYQDEAFIERFPDFSPISRFGIGILSCFMIADNVEIITCHPDDDHARQMSLRSVHGKYLIRLLDKDTDESARQLLPHGTIVRLKLRASAELSSVLEIARKWIVLPGVEVSVVIDDTPPENIGFTSAREAIEDVLRSNYLRYDLDANAKIRVEQKEVNGVTVAYALEWSEWFREWTFLRYPKRDRRRGELPLLGTCIEGVRVEFETPGFDGYSIVAIANAVGPNAPKTNVARSGIEATAEARALNEAIYSIYCSHVASEVDELCNRRGFSLTWATKESRYLLDPLLRRADDVKPKDPELLLKKTKELPLLLIERGGARDPISAMELNQEREIWVIDCAFFRSAELIIREVASRASLSRLISSLDAQSFSLPNAPVLCGFEWNDSLDRGALDGKEVDKVVVHQDQRRIDLRYVQTGDPPRWRSLTFNPRRLSQWDNDYLFERLVRIEPVYLARRGVEIIGLQDEIAVRAFGRTYFVPGTAISEYLLSWFEKSVDEATPEDGLIVATVFSLATQFLGRNEPLLLTAETLRRHFEFHRSREIMKDIKDIIDLDELRDLLNSSTWKLFDPAFWVRKNES
jgi:molecular chaperone HtpG